MRAYCLIRPQPYYRREAFVAGLRAAGHHVELKSPDKLNADTLLVIWNRYAQMHDLACRVEVAGGKVIVAENGYYGAGGTSPKFDVHPGGPKAEHYYALGLGWHNTEGTPDINYATRVYNLGKPSRVCTSNPEGHILICPNRSFGVGERMMHPDWAARVVAQIKKITSRRIVIRNHPGNDAPKRALSVDLDGAYAMVIWSSSCGVHALMRGIPVVCRAPHWICKHGAHTDAVALAHGFEIHDDYTVRMSALEWMAQSQWTCEEIESGAPFRHLLPNAG